MALSSVRTIIAKHLAVDVKYVVDDAEFVFDLGANPLDMMELVMRLEEALYIEINQAEATSLATVKDALELVERKLRRRLPNPLKCRCSSKRVRATNL